jgi:hypothetical protein
MRNSDEADDTSERPMKRPEEHDHLPNPSASYRRRAWIEFQKALDPLAPIKPLPPPRP